MRNSWMAFLVMLAVCFPLMAFEDLGPLEKAKQQYPEMFISEKVLTVRINNLDHWVFSGKAEKIDDSESDSELWQEAELSARAAFFEYMTKDKPGHEVVMHACSPLYRLKDKHVYTIILAVPAKSVSVNKKCSVASGDKHIGVESIVTQQIAKTAASPVVGVRVESPNVGDVLAPKPSDVCGNGTNEQAKVGSKRMASEKIELYRQRLEKDPKNWKAGARLGVLLDETGDRSGAVKVLDVAVRNVMEDAGADATDKSRVLMIAAKENESLHKFGIALKYYRIVQRLDCPSEVKDIAVTGIHRILINDATLIFQ